MGKLGRKEILIFTLCLLIGMFLVFQGKNVGGQKLYVSGKAISEYEAVIASEKMTTENLLNQIEDAKRLLEDYENSSERQTKKLIKEKLSNEKDDFSIFAGLGEVKGKGVRIVVDDGTRDLFEGEDINNVLVHDIDIILIINELKRCKAEAIAVNGHRISPSTSIVCSGYTVRMDGITYARPFEITAIGDSRRIASDLLAPDGYGTSLKDFGVIFSLEYVDEVIIPAAESMQNFKYAQNQNASQE